MGRARDGKNCQFGSSLDHCESRGARPDHARTTTTPPPAKQLYWVRCTHRSSGAAALKRAAEGPGGLCVCLAESLGSGTSLASLGSVPGLFFPFERRGTGCRTKRPQRRCQPDFGSEGETCSSCEDRKRRDGWEHPCCLRRDRARGRGSQGALPTVPGSRPGSGLCSRSPASPFAAPASAADKRRRCSWPKSRRSSAGPPMSSAPGALPQQDLILPTAS